MFLHIYCLGPGSGSLHTDPDPTSIIRIPIHRSGSASLPGRGAGETQLGHLLHQHQLGFRVILVVLGPELDAVRWGRPLTVHRHHTPPTQLPAQILKGEKVFVVGDNFEHGGIIVEGQRELLDNGLDQSLEGEEQILVS